MGVVHLALIIVGKDLVGLLRGLEADFGFFAVVFCDLVGVMCECGLRGLDVCSFVTLRGRLRTLWYAFLISILLAPFSISSTSVLISSCDSAHKHMHTVEVDFFIHCSRVST